MRAFARDLAAKLENFAICEKLSREKIGEFDLKNALDFAEISDEKILEIRPDFFNLKNCEISVAQKMKFQNGQKIFLENSKPENSGNLISVFCENNFCGIGFFSQNFLQPKKVYDEKI